MSDFNKNFLKKNIPDPVFQNFDRRHSKLLVDSEGGGDINFLGVHIPLNVDALRHQGEYWSGRSSNYWPDDPSLPSPFHEDYFEYVDLLYSICESDEHFQMAEVGAGYGRWILNAAAAIKRCNTKKIVSSFFLGFEADPDRISFFHKMMKINKIEKKSYKLIEKIVSEKNINNIKLPFIINKKSGAKFGGMIVDDTRDNLSGRKSISNEDWVKIKYISTCTLSDSCSRYGVFDFMNFDIQNAEINVIPSSIDYLSKHVKLVHVATHSTLADEVVQKTFINAGWHSRWAFNWQSKIKTALGDSISFRDGVFSFVNPYLQNNINK